MLPVSHYVEVLEEQQKPTEYQLKAMVKQDLKIPDDYKIFILDWCYDEDREGCIDIEFYATNSYPYNVYPERSDTYNFRLKRCFKN